MGLGNSKRKSFHFQAFFLGFALFVLIASILASIGFYFAEEYQNKLARLQDEKAQLQLKWEQAVQDRKNTDLQNAAVVRTREELELELDELKQELKEKDQKLSEQEQQLKLLDKKAKTAAQELEELEERENKILEELGLERETEDAEANPQDAAEAQDDSENQGKAKAQDNEENQGGAEIQDNAENQGEAKAQGSIELHTDASSQAGTEPRAAEAAELTAEADNPAAITPFSENNTENAAEYASDSAAKPDGFHVASVNSAVSAEDISSQSVQAQFSALKDNFAEQNLLYDRYFAIIANRKRAEAQRLYRGASLRQYIAQSALSFLGNRYVYGGNDPYNGVDCSGLTRYIYANIAGIYLPRTAAEQAACGRAISEDYIRMGDLVFYSRGGPIDHVAIYIGNGEVVHASNARSGIIKSALHYRNPVKIVTMLGN